MTYLWRDGILIKVAVNLQGRPLKLLWNDERYAVHRIINRWIIDDMWWHSRLWRDYWQVITETGSVIIIFQDVVTGDWYLQRLND